MSLYCFSTDSFKKLSFSWESWAISSKSSAVYKEQQLIFYQVILQWQVKPLLTDDIQKDRKYSAIIFHTEPNQLLNMHKSESFPNYVLTQNVINPKKYLIYS